MAEEVKKYHQHVDEPCVQDTTAVKVAEEGPVEVKDRGLFDFMGKKEKEEEKKVKEEVLVTEFEQKAQVCEPEHKEEEKEEKKHESILEKLHRTGSSSSSVSFCSSF